MKIFIYLVIGFFLLIIYVRFLEGVSLFIPTRRIQATPRDVGLDFDDVYFSTEDHVRLNGWLVRAEGRSAQAGTLIFCHGNAGNIGDRVEKILNFHDLGVNVFIFDYRGYGRSQGHPTEHGMYRDAAAAFDYLRTRKDIDQNKLVFYGASMGGVAAIDAVTRRPAAALIADSTFTSAADMAKTIAFFVPSFLLKAKLDNASKIKAVTVPKLFIHSPEDDTVPFALGEKLYNSAPEPKEFLKISGSHNDGYAQSQGVFFPGIKNFLEKYDLL